MTQHVQLVHDHATFTCFEPATSLAGRRREPYCTFMSITSGPELRWLSIRVSGGRDDDRLPQFLDGTSHDASHSYKPAMPIAESISTPQARLKSVRDLFRSTRSLFQIESHLKYLHNPDTQPVQIACATQSELQHADQRRSKFDSHTLGKSIIGKGNTAFVIPSMRTKLCDVQNEYICYIVPALP